MNEKNTTQDVPADAPEYADDWYCPKCNKGPMSDADDCCKFCGEPWANEDVRHGYNDKLVPDEQITAEEDIAFKIYSTENNFLDEEECAKLGRDILKLVLAKFRPDLFD